MHLTANAPEEHDVYSLGPLITVRSSGARCAFADSFYMPLLTERMKFRQTGYKYFAPLEQPSVAS